MVTDPRFAPKRTDLPWLRRRRVTAATAPPEQTHAAVADFLSGHATRHERQEAAPAAAAPSRPAAAAPPPPPATPNPTPNPTPSSPPPPPTRPPAAPSSSLDLDEPTAAPARAAHRQPEAPSRRTPPPVRVRADERTILTVADPTVTLTRLQSAIGTLTFEAACSSDVGDLRIGCGYELNSGATSTVQLTQGSRTAPAGSRRPVLVAAHDRFETIGVDLRQALDLRRLIVYAFSEARQPLTWGGTLITTTHGGARIELPLETLQSGDSAVLLSVYNVSGEFVLRAEMQTLFGDVRECCRSFGFERITWLDDRTPVE